MNTRRDILKYFGVGTVIAPAVGAGPLARIIEPANVELALPPRITTPINLRHVRSVSLSLEMEDGTRRVMSGGPFNMEYREAGMVSPDDKFTVSFLRDNVASPSCYERVARFDVVPNDPGRCPYCRSMLDGPTCKRCGASA